jgi:F-type H+-transporting ATPase subunit b
MRIRNINLIAIAAILLLPALGFCQGNEADEIANKQGIFSGTMADAWWTVIAFLMLLVLLGRFAWKPMLNGLKARQDYIAQQIAGAETSRKQAEKLLADYNGKMEQLEAKGQEIIKSVTARAEEEGRLLAEKARAEAAGIKAKAHEDIEHARIAASQQLWNEVGDVVLALGTEVLGRKLEKTDNDRFIQDAIVKLREQKASPRRPA